MNLEEKLMHKASQEISDRIDFEVLADLLVTSCGWTKIEFSPFVNNKQAVDIRCWIDEHQTGHVRSRGRTWLFENAKDATMFILKWT